MRGASIFSVRARRTKMRINALMMRHKKNPDLVSRGGKFSAGAGG